MKSEMRSEAEKPFRFLPDNDKEKIMRHIRALVSNGFCRPGLFSWGVKKLHEQMIIMVDLGFIRIPKEGKVEIYHITKCQYVEVPVTMSGRRPRRII